MRCAGAPGGVVERREPRGDPGDRPAERRILLHLDERHGRRDSDVGRSHDRDPPHEARRREAVEDVRE